MPFGELLRRWIAQPATHQDANILIAHVLPVGPPELMPMKRRTDESKRRRGATGQRGARGLKGKRGPRGLKGKPGTRGQKGKRGARGKRGEEGLQGRRGKVGPAGQRGAQGVTGPRDDWEREVLRAVEERFADVYHQLDIQLRRIAQPQAEMDRLSRSPLLAEAGDD
jgi:hypothetical protein